MLVELEPDELELFDDEDDCELDDELESELLELDDKLLELDELRLIDELSLDDSPLERLLDEESLDEEDELSEEELLLELDDELLELELLLSQHRQPIVR